MTWWRWIVYLALILLPAAVATGLAGYALWETGRLGFVGWFVPLGWGLAFLWRRWQLSEAAIPDHLDAKRPLTPQDEAALEIVRAAQSSIAALPPAQLSSPKCYEESLRSLAIDLARHYSPNTNDAIDNVTVAELLTVAHLVAEDMETWVRETAPGSHLVTVGHWKLLVQAPGWVNFGSNLYWAAAVLLDPTAIGRLILSKATVTPFTQSLQSQLFGAFAATVVGQAGGYLIELYSGRLKLGAARYRAWRGASDATIELRHVVKSSDASPIAEAPPALEIVIIGQVKAGKSSLVNAILGERRAATDVVPATNGCTAYDLVLPESRDRLKLVDTAGYNDANMSPAAMASLLATAHSADLLVLVVDARAPAKAADVKTLEALRAYFAQSPSRKPPRVLAVMTHIDGLSPLLDWTPPYDVFEPSRPKERSIANALAFVRETLGDAVDVVVPACTDGDHQRVYGVEEFVIPSLLLLLDDARSVSLLRNLRRATDRDRFHQLWSQTKAAGRRLTSLASQGVREWLQNRADDSRAT